MRPREFQGTADFVSNTKITVITITSLGKLSQVSDVCRRRDWLDGRDNEAVEDDAGATKFEIIPFAEAIKLVGIEAEAVDAGAVGAVEIFEVDDTFTVRKGCMNAGDTTIRAVIRAEVEHKVGSGFFAVLILPIGTPDEKAIILGEAEGTRDFRRELQFDTHHQGISFLWRFASGWGLV